MSGNNANVADLGLGQERLLSAFSSWKKMRTSRMPSKRVVKDINRKTRKQYSAEENLIHRFWNEALSILSASK